MKKKSIAIGIYQDRATVRSVIAELKKRNFTSFATIDHQLAGHVEIFRYFPYFALWFILIALLAIGYFSFLNPFGFSRTILAGLTALIGALTAAYIFSRVSKPIDHATLDRFKNLILANEICMIVQIDNSHVREVTDCLRRVKSGHPATFLLRPAMFEDGDAEIPLTPVTEETLGNEAIRLACESENPSNGKNDAGSLMKRFRQSKKMLQFCRHDIADAEYIEQKLSSPAEWLLDNMYILEGAIEDVKLNLPKKFYKQLPKIVSGPLAGFPRIYGLAVELVKNTAGSLSRENIIFFLRSYQSVRSLTIGELWAFPLMLRLRLIEWVEYLAIHVDDRMREGESASFWGNRLLNAAQHDPDRLALFLEELSASATSLSGHFAEELLDHLFDEESALPQIRKWLEEHFEGSVEEVIHRDHLEETSEQLIFSGCIKSLMTLGQLSWPTIFEETSSVDAILSKDPAEIYSKMDFATRNSYRNMVEKIAKNTCIKEEEIAEIVLGIADRGMNDYERHVGYYLVDDGLENLEQATNYRPGIVQSLERLIKNYSTSLYLGGIGLLTIGTEYFLYRSIQGTLNGYQTVLFLILSLIPLSELSIQVINLLLTAMLPPFLLPKMSFETGIPPENKTLVVVPTMLLTPESIREDIDQLEIRYLANTDSSLKFGLFGDFSDAKERDAESDSSLLAIAIAGIQALEKKYGEGKFYLFMRRREWSDSENAWIGHERKRGKLEYLNRFLTGEALPENIVYVGKAEALKGTRYVITLDDDTQLTKDQARSLVEIISHPLNRPFLDADRKKTERGYTIIQPRVGTDFIHAKASLFCKIFSEPTVVDPYTQAISNVYQDLTGEGSYHGKGIYDVEAFHSILMNRFPNEHLLSHDLIEGAYVRVGFASHVCLFDIHPKDYLSWSKRHHRWMRGDWQIVDWLKKNVPSQSGQEPNVLSSLNRWKILDNLRRALLPVSLLLLSMAAWFSPLAKGLTCLAAVILLLPSIALCFNKLWTFSRIKPFLSELKILSLRSLISLAMLPYEAFSSLDALGRVLYRRGISHRRLLEWNTGQYRVQNAREHRNFVLRLGGVSLFGVLVSVGVAYSNPSALPFALPFCFLWIAAPFIIAFIDKPLDLPATEGLDEIDKHFLRKIARKTWRYFDESVGVHTHWMPPDNYQTALNIEIARRTSPTNTGLWLTALLSAYDFNFITCDDVIDKASATIGELKKLERYEGHFLNWYNIETTEPLFPRYVSTVDSGNFLACIWTLKQGLRELIASPIIPSNALSGIQDTYEVLRETDMSTELEKLHRHLFVDVKNLPEFIAAVKETSEILKKLSVENTLSESLKQLEEGLRGWESIVSRYFSWVEVLLSLLPEELHRIDPRAVLWKDHALAWKGSLEEFADKKLPHSLVRLIEEAGKEDLPNEIKVWRKRLEEALSTAEWFAGEKIGLVTDVIKEIDGFTQEMDLKFLYNPDRKLFAIGYNVDNRKLDTSFYDLLASEARIASLVAIAKEDVPLEHWWSLGRVYGIVRRRKVLLSWGGTMFEYLMPLMFHKHYSDSLMGDACDAAVDCQIAYGKRRGIPWGISESAFSALDSFKVYQYKSFGVPGLGLKRGLEYDLVVSPYSSVLALAVKPQAAMQNLKVLAEKIPFNLTGYYGYYESIDFTRQRSPEGERGVVVYTYMAHHQGMILSTLNNLLNGEALIRRFQKDPRISGVGSLLYERIPYTAPVKISAGRRELLSGRLKPFSRSPIMGGVETTESITPKINLLSNGKYSLMITNTGGGYSRWGDIEIYRWRADTTLDAWGSFCYVKDVKSGNVLSTTYQPTRKKAREYSVNFRGDKAEFKRRDDGIETLTDVVVSPEDNAEVRMITLINHSDETVKLELTSYMELSLAPHTADRAHPSFNKLFIETEALKEDSALLGFRRLRSPGDSPVWAVHVVSTSSPAEGEVQYETDRNLFIGRGRSLQNPLALEGKLSDTVGTVLDPIFSLRRTVSVEPGKRVRLSFVTAAADSRTAAVGLIDKYKDIAAGYRAIELAWNYSQLELRHLRIYQEEVQLYQKLASRLIYPHVQFRLADRVFKNRLGQSTLWAQGISGDLPIVVVTVGDIYDVGLVKQLLIAHAFWSLRGLKVDLVIFNEEEASYEQPLQEHLKNQIQSHCYRAWIDRPAGVFLRNSSLIPPDELNLIYAAAHVVLVASRGLLRQQLVSPKPKMNLQPKLIVNEKIKEVPSKPLPFLELPYFNGLGGFSQDGRSYVIYLAPGTACPAPWINVLSNPNFGTLVSEAGLGVAWYGNSQSNRLTSWSNDPLSDPITDAIYIRDEEMGRVWTPTPGPIRELDAYRISHSQGYTRFEHNSHGIEQELLIFVPVDDEGGLPVRIQRLRVANRSPRRRRLSFTAYTEWVLGGDKEETQLHVVTEWDSINKALLAYNRYHPDFGSHVAFAFSTAQVASYSGDRTEFLGRNGSGSSPEALSRKSLSGNTGAALDPCAALQAIIEIEPENEAEVVFVIGYAADISAAQDLIAQCRVPGRIEELLTETIAWWDKTLETVLVDVPDQAMNFFMNRWLIYQDLACRFWGRTAFYQSSGAYGFRDQLQDSMALLYALPSISREYILKAASRQFVEGDAQHWWHPQSGAGIRTRCSDDFLWLPFVVAHYVRTTGDAGILDEVVPFLEADLLEENQEEVFGIPKVSETTASLLEHCRRALRKGMTAGPHGLPLIGSCDWNDGMNLIGIGGKGESVWLAWFLIHVMNDFAELLTLVKEDKEAETFRNEAKALSKVVEETAWDGAWYRRAYFDDGTPVGSRQNEEAFIDSLAQSWAVISGAGDPERCGLALKSAEEYLVNREANLVLLLTPPFDKTALNPGYIKGYPPGVRENGGQYTHGSSWLAMAFARCGEGNKAVDLLRMLLPTVHTPTPEANQLYKVEPYVIAGDIYDLKERVGRGGWTWYSGSASWIYRILLEEILGFKLRGQVLRIECTIPKEWESFKLNYRYKSTVYKITVTNPEHISAGACRITLDGVVLSSPEIHLVDEGDTHEVLVNLLPIDKAS